MALSRGPAEKVIEIHGLRTRFGERCQARSTIAPLRLINYESAVFTGNLGCAVRAAVIAHDHQRDRVGKVGDHAADGRFFVQRGYDGDDSIG